MPLRLKHRSELLEYVCHGSKRPDDDQELFRKKTARVRRNLNLAFRSHGFQLEG